MTLGWRGEVIAMTQNERIVQALNCVSSGDHFECCMGRIIRKQLQLYDSVVITTEKAMQTLETRIRTQAVKLDEAKQTLRELRESMFGEAKLALAKVAGD